MKKTFTDNRITARDLQIGDYFYLRPRRAEDDCTIIRINSISRRKFGYFENGSKSERYVRYCEDRLVPIRLHEGYIFDTIYTDDAYVSGLMRFCNLMDTFGAVAINIEYIHELQHLLNIRNQYNKFSLKTDNVLDYGKEEDGK